MGRKEWFLSTLEEDTCEEVVSCVALQVPEGTEEEMNEDDEDFVTVFEVLVEEFLVIM